MRRFSYVFFLPLVALATPAQAQLISERLEDDRRVCTYYGSERSPTDELVQRRVNVGIGENCPAVAPFRDPSAPPPPNAMLVGMITERGQRVCIYTQGGVQFRRGIPLSANCAMTPALLAQNPTERRRSGY